MPRIIKLKNPDGVVIGKLKVPDDAQPEQIRAAMERLKEARAGATPPAASTEHDDSSIRCAACPGRVIVKRGAFPAHIEQHRQELERLEKEGKGTTAWDPAR